MNLADLLKNCPFSSNNPFEHLANGGSTQISSICSDSRKVVPGSLFIAVKGLVTDGHDYIASAFEQGAAAVVAQTHSGKFGNVIRVSDSRLAMACIAANFYGHPSKEMTLIGITGTNGKTTTSYLCESILTAAGFNTGVIGTVEVRYGGKSFDTPVTTPDAIDLQHTLRDMKDAGVSHVVMEVSSHGLDLRRVDFCEFNAGIFTNLTQDHLDYHSDLDDYFNCKKRFFTDFLKNAPSIINIDDPYGGKLAEGLSSRKVHTVSTKEKSGLYAKDITDTIEGLCATLCSAEETFEIKTPLTGTFNLENILCAARTAQALGIDNTDIVRGIENCKSIPGRLEKIDNTVNRHLFVDYAHTPDALESILKTLRQRAPRRLITVFGCGGDRDRTKRPLMGQIACRYSDIAIATSDNPRSEKPETIIKDITDGLKGFYTVTPEDLKLNTAVKGYMTRVDRKEAIELAVSLSQENDIIVVAGKGHENYQITNTGTIHFDDREELKKAADALADSLKPITWTLEDIESALETSNSSTISDKDTVFSMISTDSRNIMADQVFLALAGENFDGHNFIDAVIEKQVKAFVVSKKWWNTRSPGQISEYSTNGLSFFVCDDTLTALGKLARFQRMRANVNVLAITGSSGKTTTRKICEEVFKQQYVTHSTTGNLNNEIGVPLTLLKLSRAHEWAIIEMGMNHAGEIARLTRIALPDIAMVLNTAGVHLEGLGSVENVARAKAEIYEGVVKGGTAILPGFDEQFDLLESLAVKNKEIARLVFGNSPKTMLSARDIQLNDTGICFKAETEGTLVEFSIPSPGLFMVNNCLAAIVAACCAGISIENIQNGFDAFTPVSGRMNIYALTDQITLIDDTYNANPSSVSKALETLEQISRNGYGMAVLGDMLELGETSADLHREIGNKAAASRISKLFVYGEQASHMVEGALEAGMKVKDIFHGDKDAIATNILKNSRPGTWVLVKGSRGMAMETVIAKLKNLIANL